MVTLTALTQQALSAASATLNVLVGGSVSALASAASFLGGLAGSLVSSLSTSPFMSLTGIAIPPVEIPIPLLGSLGGLAEWALFALIPVLSMLVPLVVLFVLIPAEILGMIVGIFIGIVAGLVVGFILGLLTGWFGFIITPILAGGGGVLLGLIAGWTIGALVAVVADIIIMSIFVLLGLLLSPLLLVTNAALPYFLNLLYVGIIFPILTAFWVFLVLGIILIPYLVIMAIPMLFTNLPLWAFVVGDIAVLVIEIILGIILGLIMIGVGMPVVTILTLASLVVLDLPVIAIIGLVGILGAIIPGPSSIGTSAGMGGGAIADLIPAALVSFLAMLTTIPANITGTTSTNIVTSLGTSVPNVALGLFTWLVNAVISVPAWLGNVLSIGGNATAALSAVMAGLTGTVTGTGGNRLIHAAMGLLR